MAGMLTGIGEFFQRRKRGILWVVVGTAAVYSLGKYAQFKVEEMLKAVVPLLRDLTIVTRRRMARSTMTVAWMRPMVMLCD